MTILVAASVAPARLRTIGYALLLIVTIVALTALLVSLGGYDVVRALRAFWLGSVGSRYAFTSATLVRAIPLALTGCAVAIAFRAGVFNIGAEGQLLVGATGATAIALAVPSLGVGALLLALMAGAAAGGAWAGIAAFLRARFGVLEVISTIMLNFVALYGVSYAVRGPLQEPTHAYPQTASIAQAVHLPLLPGGGRLHAGLFVAVIVIAVAGWAMRHTAAGFRVLAVGESPAAAASAGLIDTRAVSTAAFVVSGAIAGLAGAVEVLGVTYALYENLSPGYGYTAIAVALLAGLDPWRVALAALLFAALEAGAGAMQRDAGVPATLVATIEALIVLAVIALQAQRARRTADAGIAGTMQIPPG